MRRISYLMTFLMAALLMACGGGGGAPGLSSGATTVTTTPAALFTTAPSSISLQSGTTANYQVSGGVAPYAVASDVVSLVSATIIDSTLSITAIKGGAASVFVTDSAGTKLTVNVSVPLPGALFTTAPTSGLILLSGGSAGSYGVGGGAGPLVATSANTSVVTATINQQTSVLTLQPIAVGNATVEIRDTAGTTVQVNVTVSAAGSLFTTAPSSITTAVSISNGYLITGGSPPYIATSSNASVVQTSVNGNSLSISGLAGGAASVIIADSKGSTLSIGVTVTAPVPGALFTTAPSALTLAVSTNAVTYSISGGVPPYLANSSNVSVLTAGTSGTAGQFLDLKGVASGFASVTISDATGAVVTVSVTVPAPGSLFSTAPSALTVAVGGAPEYLITGGLPFTGGALPYTAVSSNTAVATGEIAANGKLTIRGLASGAANIIISDSKGTTLTVAVTVPAPAALITSAPPNMTLLAGGGATGVFVISGGVPDPANGYMVSSSNGSVATVALQADKKSFTVAGNLAGVATVFVTDSKGIQTTISVTVVAPTPVAASAAAVTVQSGNSTVVTLSGGSPAVGGYTASSSNVGVAIVQVSNGNNLTIAGVSAGLATVTVSDSKGNTFALPVTVPQAGVFYTTAPSDLSLAVNESQSYLLAAGTQPYQSIATSSDSRVATGFVSGGALTIRALLAGTATIQAFDAAGGKVTVRVTVGAGGGASANFYPTLMASLSSIDGKIASSGYTTLTVTMKDPSGKGIPNQPIDVAADPKLAFPDGNTALTNASGVASFRIKRASLLVSGAGALAVSYSYKLGAISTYPDGSTPPNAAQVVSTYVGYQLTTANVVLNMKAPTTPMSAYGTQQFTVNVTVDGLTSDTPVLVNFSATCGQVTPVSVSTNSLGVATTTYSATDAAGAVSTVGCGGKSVEVTASTVGADAAVKTVVVTAAPATNMKFVSATPDRIYLKDSGGITQSLVVFQLVNAQDAPILAQDIVLSLKTLDGSAVNNVKASFYELGNVANKTLTTDSSGKVSIPVFSGTVPTSVLVNAKLASDTKVNTDSAVLVIASGRPAQARTSISIQSLSIEGWNTDGTTTNVTLSLADRQGNPVPDGTAVNFTTAGGVMVPPVCNTGVWVNPATGLTQGFAGNSQCTVSIRSSNPRLTNSTDPKSRWAGRVAILAHAAGEEDFVDNNKNNIFDTGDTFTDLGNAYRDADETGTFTPGEFSVPRATSACQSTGVPPSPGVLVGVPSTCDGVWGATDVRQQGIVIFATGSADITAASQIRTSGLSYQVADMNGNSPPTGSKIVVTAVDGTSSNATSCAVVAGGAATVGNTLVASTFGVSLSGCEDGDSVNVTVNSTLGVVSSRTFSIPSAKTSVAGSFSFTVSGTSPFTAVSNNIGVATVSVAGSTVTVTGVALGSTAITVSDSRTPEPQRVEVYSVKVE